MMPPHIFSYGPLQVNPNILGKLETLAYCNRAVHSD
jgi:hypothetical protein